MNDQFFGHSQTNQSIADLDSKHQQLLHSHYHGSVKVGIAVWVGIVDAGIVQLEHVLAACTKELQKIAAIQPILRQMVTLVSQHPPITTVLHNEAIGLGLGDACQHVDKPFMVAKRFHQANLAQEFTL